MVSLRMAEELSWKFPKTFDEVCDIFPRTGKSRLSFVTQVPHLTRVGSAVPLMQSHMYKQYAPHARFTTARSVDYALAAHLRRTDKGADAPR